MFAASSRRLTLVSGLCGLAFAATACGSISPAEEAGEIFEATTSTLVDFHLDVIDGGQFPETDTWDCDSGTIELQTTDDSSGLTLGHTFADCELDGRVYSGELPYLDVRECAAGYDIQIQGTLSIEGAANFDSCSFDAREHCDATFSGRVCGMDLSETGFERVRDSEG